MFLKLNCLSLLFMCIFKFQNHPPMAGVMFNCHGHLLTFLSIHGTSIDHDHPDHQASTILVGCVY